MTTKWFPSIAVTLGLTAFIAIADFYGPSGSEPLGPLLGTNLTTDTQVGRTNWIDPLKLTNLIVWETPKPSKVTIWFQYQWDDGFEVFSPHPGSISTNVWRMTVSNATEMVKAHLKSQGSQWKFITLTGIWRDE